MITAEKVKTALCSLLAAEFPNIDVYVDLLPSAITNPAFFVEQYEIATRDVNHSTIEEVCKTAITYPASTDTLGSDNDLALISERVRGLLRDGVIYIEDRAVQCSVLSKKSAGQSRLEVTTTHWETRSEPQPQPLPPMGDINITRKERG